MGDRFSAIEAWLSTQLGKRKVADYQSPVPFQWLAEEPPENWPELATSRSLLAEKAAAGPTDLLRAEAGAQRLNTGFRQSLFVAVMGAEDFKHAADRLAQVAATVKSGPSEACLILFHCAVREQSPNPFYEHVASELCQRPAPWGKRFGHHFKRAAVQHLQQAHDYGVRAVVNLAELCAALVVRVGVPLEVLRFLKFGNGGIFGLLLRHMTESVLRRLPDLEETTRVFGEVKKFDDVCQGMLLVLDALVKKRLPKELQGKFSAARRAMAR